MNNQHVTDIGQGPVVVLLHALLLDRKLFQNQAEHLAEKGFRVIVPDYAGHGSSPRIALDSPSVMAMADQVFEMLDQRNITEPVTLGGLSMGGYVAFAAWERYKDRISNLILMDTRAVTDTADEANNRKRACDLIRQAGSVGPLAVTMLPRLLSKLTVQRRPDVWREIAGVLEQTDLESACDALMALACRPDRRSMLAGIHVPTLVLVGQDDIISTPAEMAEIAGSIPNSRFVEIPEAGHLPAVERPEAVSQAISGFLATHLSQS